MEEQQTFGGAPNFRPKNYLVESILVTIFCCLPFGIAGIVNAANVNSRYDVGDYAGAAAASAAAWKWTKIGLIAWAVMLVLYVVLFVVLGFGAGLMGAYS